MLGFFNENILAQSKKRLRDIHLTLPFANIRLRSDKKHGFRNQRKK